MIWLEWEHHPTLIAKILSLARQPTSETNIRIQLQLNPTYTEVIVNSLTESNLLKAYANSPSVQGKLVVTSPKGHEFLRRFHELLELLGLDPNDEEALNAKP
ncbi:MAG: hypothetical protein ACUVUF_06935 [Candidatus Bathycorpusculaceae bacterium]